MNETFSTLTTKKVEMVAFFLPQKRDKQNIMQQIKRVKCIEIKLKLLLVFQKKVSIKVITFSFFRNL